MQKKWSNKIVSVLLSVLLALVIMPVAPVFAAGTITSTATGGAWSVGSTWLGGIVPGIGDSVIIATGATVTLDSATMVAGSLTIQSGATLDTTSTNYALVVSSSFSNSGTLEANASTITISGAFTMDAGAFNGATSTLNLNGAVTKTGGTFTPGSVNYGATGDQTVIGNVTYVTLATSGSGNKTTGGNTTISGTLTVGSGTTFTVSTFSIAVTGATTVNGTLTHTSATGMPKTYSGNVTINSGGVWNDSAATIAISFGGNFQNDGTLNAGTGIHTFSGASKTFSGTNPISIPNVTITGAHTNTGTLIAGTLTVNGVTLTNNGTLTVGTTLTGTGGLIQGTGATLNIGGSSSIATLTASASPNTVNYNKTGGQTVNASTTTYHHLILSGSGAKNLTNVTTINGDLTLSTVTPGSTTTTAVIAAAFTINGNLNIGASTLFTVGAFNITVTGAAVVSGTLTHNNTAGAKTYTGDITINSGGVWNETVAALISFGGNLQNDGVWTAGAGMHTFSGAGKTFSGTSAISIPNMTITGAYTNNGTLTVSTTLLGAGSLSQGASGTLNLGASADNFTLSTLDASTSGNTVNYNGAAQTVKATPYHHLTLSGSGVKTLTGLTTVNGDLTFAGTTASATTTNTLAVGGNLSLTGTGINTVTTGAALTIGGNFNITGTGATTFTVGAFPITVTGATTISGLNTSVNSTLLHTAGATPVYTGLVTISPNGIWDNSANVNINLRGGLANNSAETFSAGTGVYTFDTNAQAIGGMNPISIPNITVTGVTVTNNGTLSVGTALSGTGGLTQGADDTLNIGGTSGISTLTASASGNTVNYNGAAQTVVATPYHHLTFSGSGAKTLTGLTTVNGNLTLSGTASATTAANLTIGGALAIGPGTAFTVGAFDITVAGATTLSGTSTLTHNSSTGAKTYSGDVIINSGSTWFDNAAVIAVSFGGNFQNSGILNAGTGVHTFTGTGKLFSGTISIPNIAISGSYTNNGTLTVGTALSGAGSLTQGTSSSKLNIGGSSSIVTLTASASGNTVTYNMPGAQTIRAIPYYHLTTGGSSTKTLDGNVTVNGALAIGSGTTLDVSASNYAINVVGNWTNSGTFAPQSGTVTLQGSATQSMNGTSSFNNLTINNSAGVTLSSDETVNGVLTLTNGKITTGFRSLIIGTTGSVTGANATKYVFGRVQKNFATGAQSFTFDIGDATNYMPVTLAFASVSTSSGGVTVSTTAGEHPNIATSGIESTKDVNRYWTLASAGTFAFTGTYDAIFRFTSGDLDGGANFNNFIVKRNINSSTWNLETIGTLTATSAQATGIASLGSFAIGEPDTTAPTVVNVTSTTADGAYKAGATIAVTVTFSELVKVTGTPQLTLETGTTDRTANYAGGNGSVTLIFNYVVQAGDTSSDLDYVNTTALALNGGTINDPGANAAVLTLPTPGTTGSLGLNKAIMIDTTAPTVTNVDSSNADGSYTTGNTIAVTVTFSEPVNVTGTPTLMLETGTTDRTASYVSGSGTGTLTFEYTVQAGDASSDLDYVDSASLTLNGGTIKDATANDAALTLPTPGATGSLGINKAIVIDTTIPGVTNVTSTTLDGSYTTGNTIVITVTFSEPVNVTGTPTLMLETGATDRTASYVSGSGTGTLTFEYTVQAGDTSSDLDYVDSASLTLNGGTIKDATANDAALTLPTPGATGSLGFNKAIVISTTYQIFLPLVVR